MIRESRAVEYQRAAIPGALAVCYSQSGAEAVRDAFVAKYPGIQVELIRQTAQVVYQRLTESMKTGTHALDVFASAVPRSC